MTEADRFVARWQAGRDALMARDARWAAHDNDPVVRLRSHMMNRPLGVMPWQWILAPF